MRRELQVSSRSRAQLIDVTREVARVAAQSGIADGVATVFVPHTTAGVTINENADPDVVRDILATLERLVPRNGDYRHAEGNSDAHLKSAMVGYSVTVLVEAGRLVLGTWQGIYFAEFDGPRTRRMIVDVRQ